MPRETTVSSSAVVLVDVWGAVPAAEGGGDGTTEEEGEAGVVTPTSVTISTSSLRQWQWHRHSLR